VKSYVVSLAQLDPIPFRQPPRISDLADRRLNLIGFDNPVFGPVLQVSWKSARQIGSWSVCPSRIWSRESPITGFEQNRRQMMNTSGGFSCEITQINPGATDRLVNYCMRPAT
jgi:hypothetical protein